MIQSLLCFYIKDIKFEIFDLRGLVKCRRAFSNKYIKYI